MSVSPASIFVVIPCYNEGAVVRETILTVLGKGYSVIVVDDASKDNTRERLQDLPVTYIRHRVNLGQGAALQTGMDIARQKGAAYVIHFDADGQHEADDIPGLIATAQEKLANIVFGSRFLPGANSAVPASRKWLLKLARFVNCFFSGILLSDAHNGIRCLDAIALQKIRLRENRMAHASEILIQVAKQRLTYAEHPVHIRYSAYSMAKGQGNRHGLRILFELILYKLFR